MKIVPYYDLKTLINDIPNLHDTIVIAPKEMEYMISKLRTYEYKDFKEILKRRNIMIKFIERKQNNEKLR